VLIISGGYTKPEVEKSEARGMLDWAEDLNLKITKGAILLEEHALDSLENLLFSVCRFYQFFNGFPKEISCVTWKFNIKRFEIFAHKLQLSNFQVIPVGEREGQDEIAKIWARLAEEDPLYLRQPDSQKKHRKRDPWRKSHTYWQINKDFQRFFTELELVKKTKGNLEELADFYPWRIKK